MSTMKIAMLTSRPFPPECGIGFYIHNLSKKLAERGHDVTIVTRGGMAMEMTHFDGFKLYKLPFIMAYPFHVDIHNIFVNKFFKDHEGQFDIVHVHTPLPPSVLTETPVVTTFHSPLFYASWANDVKDFRFAFQRFLGIYSTRLEKSLIESSNVLTTVSDSVASDLRQLYKIKDDIFVLGNGFCCDLGTGIAATAGNPDKTVIYVGTLTHRKGLLDLLDAMKILLNDEPDANLLLIGKGPLYQTMLQRISRLRIGKNVHMLGAVTHDALSSYYSAASVFVLPSYYEGLPTVALEAMSCGLPVVGTVARGIVDLVENDRTGKLVPTKSPTELAKSILYLLKHPDVGHKLGLEGQKLVREKYTWDKVADRTLTAYELAMD
ncbi:MAG: glycosyltransferase family 4 protein [Candidatus Bathyarchaeia archaeon]